MREEQLHPDVRKEVSRVPRLPFDKAWALPLARALYNFGARSDVADGVDVSNVGTDSVKLTVYAPAFAPPTRAILWFYGGGHLAGKPGHLNRIASRFVSELNAIVVVPSYRLAPKNPYPADLDDALIAWGWILANADQLGVGRESVLIAGHSAGGGIAAALAQRILDLGGCQPAGQLLFYPMLDDRVAADQSLDEVNHFIWNNRANRRAWSAYLNPRKPGDPDVPEYAAPARRRDLTGLPATWIGQCSLDLFFAEYANYAQRLIEAGVNCKVCHVDGVPHAFEVFVPGAKIAMDFEQSAIDFARRCPL